MRASPWPHKVADVKERAKYVLLISRPVCFGEGTTEDEEAIVMQMVSLYVMSLLNKEESIDILNLDEEGKKKETTKPDKKVTTSKTTGAAAASSVHPLLSAERNTVSQIILVAIELYIFTLSYYLVHPSMKFVCSVVNGRSDSQYIRYAEKTHSLSRESGVSREEQKFH